MLADSDWSLILKANTQILRLLVKYEDSLGSFCGLGWLSLIIMPNLNLSSVKLILGWVLTILALS